VRWPAQGWRPVDPDSGDEGGTTEGHFSFFWKGDVLYGQNHAVNDSYLIGWTQIREASEDRAPRPLAHPGVARQLSSRRGQLFFPKERSPFIVPLALPGDDLTPDKFVGFYCDGSKGLYSIPASGIRRPCRSHRPWCSTIGRAAVHARVSCHFVESWQVSLSASARALESRRAVGGGAPAAGHSISPGTERSRARAGSAPGLPGSHSASSAWLSLP
jgi:hypothetical protein